MVWKVVTGLRNETFSMIPVYFGHEECPLGLILATSDKILEKLICDAVLSDWRSSLHLILQIFSFAQFLKEFWPSNIRIWLMDEKLLILVTSTESRMSTSRIPPWLAHLQLYFREHLRRPMDITSSITECGCHLKFFLAFCFISTFVVPSSEINYERNWTEEQFCSKSCQSRREDSTVEEESQLR